MARHIHLRLSLVLLLVCAGPLAAQRYYAVTRTTGAYADLADATLITDTPDTLAYGISIPFTMEGFGLPLDFNLTSSKVFIFSAGIVAVDVPSVQRLCVFDAFVAQLAWRDSTSSLSYAIEGAPGEQVLKVQWKNLGMVGNAASDFVNVQLWLSQKDNSFEVHVGPNKATGRAAYYSYSGPAIGGFVSSYDFSTYYSTYHLTGNPAHPGIDDQQGYYPMSGTPANGTIYRFAYIKPSSVDEPASAGAAVAAFQPNPCRERARIALPAALAGTAPTMLLHDALGREVRRIPNVATGQDFERGDLQPGIYFVRFLERGTVVDGGRLAITP